MIVHSNWWLSFKNDENVPREVLLGRAHGQEIDGIGLSYWQVRRASSLVHRVLDFKAQLERYVVLGVYRGGGSRLTGVLCVVL